MLVLNRHPGNAILIDGDIRIIVLACDRRGVRLGIEAPIEIGIMREEIATQMAESNRMATNSEAADAWLGEVSGADEQAPATD